MVKSRAEIQREYRERIKKDPAKYEEYLHKARLRKKANYTPASKLTRKEKSYRKIKNIEYLRRHREKKKYEQIVQQAQDRNNDHVDTSGYETASTNEQRIPLIVNLPFRNRRNGPRKRISRALSKKSIELKQLKQNYDKLQKKYKSHLRKLQRIRKAKTETENVGTKNSTNFGTRSHASDYAEETSSTSYTTESLTPRRKTDSILKSANLSAKQKSKVRKQLLLSYVMQSQINKSNRGIKHTTVGCLRGLIGGKILSKYRLGREVNRNIGLGRNRLARSGLQMNKSKEIKYKARVLEFLTRDDNSRANPGKADKLKYGKVTHQTRTLTDYLKNLHIKFLSENPEIKLSLASFCRIRPSYLKLTSFISRNCCLCTKHQNMALCVKAMKNCGLSVNLNPEKFITNESDLEQLNTHLPQSVKFGQWKRVPVDDRGKQKMVMKVVENELDRNEFIQFMNKQIQEFTQHVYRVKRQYNEIQTLKQNMKSNEVLVQMDFAENYACKTVEEIQSAYWNMTGVTLHPAVVYFKDNDDKLQHKSMMLISDELGHNSTVVLTFMDKIIPEVKLLVPEVKTIHYWTDSPTSQYRNKTIFQAVANHEQIYKVNAVWNYFEAGHGKGPCDGLGGTTKRMADEAMKCGKAIIQDAHDFYSWTQSNACSMKNIKFVFVKSDECQEKAASVLKSNIKPIKGTMKLHAVVGRGNNTIFVSDVSCYCNRCIEGIYCTGQWTVETLIEKKTSETLETNENKDKNQQLMENAAECKAIDYKEGDFIAAIYSKKWYIGKIKAIDPEDSEIEVSFMQQSRLLFQWPKEEDILWIEESDIIQKIKEPVATGKSKRMYKIPLNDIENIELLYEKVK